MRFSRVCIVAIPFLFFRCAEPPPKVPGEGPVKQVEIGKKWVVVESRAGTKLSEFLDLRYISLRDRRVPTKATAHNVEVVFGNPDNATMKDGRVYYEYYTEWG